MVFDDFDMLVLIKKNIYKNYFNIFLNKKYFKKHISIQLTNTSKPLFGSMTRTKVN
jgi:hypothetical protein